MTSGLFHTSWRFAVNTAMLYDIVTGNIVAELQMGAIPSLKPWKGGGT